MTDHARAPRNAAQTYTIDKAHSEVTFQVRHLLTKVRGRFTEFSGTVGFDQEQPEQSSVVADDRRGEVDTNNADRDQAPAVRRFLRGRHVSDDHVHQLADRQNRRRILTTSSGTLTIRGVAKEITLPVTYLGTAKDPWGNIRAGFETSSRSIGRTSASHGTRRSKREASWLATRCRSTCRFRPSRSRRDGVPRRNDRRRGRRSRLTAVCRYNRGTHSCGSNPGRVLVRSRSSPTPAPAAWVASTVRAGDSSCSASQATKLPFHAPASASS